MDEQALKRIAEQKILRDLESRPCACGKRKRAEPQHILHSDLTINPPPDPPRHDIITCRLDCIAECGVCKQVHRGSGEFAITERELERIS